MDTILGNASDMSIIERVAAKGPSTPVSPRRVLIVDDSRLQRRILTVSLKSSEYEILEAGSGEEALKICAESPPDIVISDWMMPGMTGLELCREIRARDFERYVYFIMLTSKSEKHELELALQEGADDFLSKPVNHQELRGRLVAGERLIRVERELQDKNRLVSRTLADLRKINAEVERDLVEARKLQMSLVPLGTVPAGRGRAAFLLQPSGHVGGDLVGIYWQQGSRVGLYSLDVSGHGIAAALITARLSSWLSGQTPETNIALVSTGNAIAARPPDRICDALNTRFMAEFDTGHYFTIFLAEIDTATGDMIFCQAGHPHPLIVDPAGGTRYLGDGGMPVGLIGEAEFAPGQATLGAGERLVIYSDGLSECPLPEGGQLEEEGVAQLLSRHAGRDGAALLDAVKWDLSQLAGDRELPDDVSAVIYEPPRAAP